MAGRPRAYDVTLDSKSYVVQGAESHKPLWRVESIASELGQQPQPGDYPESLRTLHLGAGYGMAYVPGCYHYALNMDCSQPGVAIMGPLVTRITLGGSASASDAFEVASKFYVMAGRYCKRIDPSDDTVKTTDDAGNGKDFGSGTTLSKSAEFQGKVYLGFTSDTPINSFDGTTWDNNDPDTGIDTLMRVKYWAKDYVESAGWRIWGAYSTAYVKGCTDDPLEVDNWHTNPFTVGDTGRAITGMAGLDGSIWVGKTDGLYLLDDTGRNPNVLQEMGQLIDSGNGANLMASSGILWVPHAAGLLAYNRATGETPSVQPFAKTGNTSPIYGTATAQARLGTWHYVAIYNGTDSYICKGRFPDPGEGLPQGWVGPMIWHPIVKLAGVQCNFMYIMGSTSPARLWFGYTASTTYDVGYIKISKTGNPLAESSMTYAASGSIYYSPLNFGYAGTADEIISIDIENEGFTSSTYAAAYISLDGGSYTQFGSNATTAGRTRIALPSGTWRSYNAAVRLDLTNNSSTSTPKVRAVTPRAAPRPAKKRYITMGLVCEDNVVPKRTGASMLSDLETLEEGAPVTLVDYWSGSATSQTVLVEKVSRQMLAQQGNEPARYGAIVECRVVV